MPLEIKKVKVILQRELGHLVTFERIGEWIGKDEDALKMRSYRNGNCSDEELQKIANGAGINFSLFFKEDDEIEKTHIKVPYYENGVYNFPKGDSYEKYFYFKKTSAYKYNPRYKESDFKIMCSLDDVLDGGKIPKKTGDIVLIDTSRRDPMDSGPYVYECHGGSYVKAAVIQVMMDNTYLFTYPNQVYKPQERNPDFLKKNKFRIVGRIIKNLDYFD